MIIEDRDKALMEVFLQGCRAAQKRIKRTLLLVPPSLLFEARKFCHEAMKRVGVLHLACTGEKHLDFEWYWRVVCALDDFQKEGNPESDFVNARFYYNLYKLNEEKRTTLNSATVYLDEENFVERILIVLGIGVGTNNISVSALESLATEVTDALEKIEDALTVFLAMKIEAMRDKEDVTYLFRVGLNGWTKAQELSDLTSSCRKEMFLVRDSLSETVLSLLNTKSIAKSKTIANIRKNAKCSLDHLCEFLDRLVKV